MNHQYISPFPLFFLSFFPNINTPLEGGGQDGKNIPLGQVVWKAEVKAGEVVFSHLSKDGDEGYPGGRSLYLSLSVCLSSISVSVTL